MRHITSFMLVSVDGYFEGPNPWAIDWHNVDDEFNDFAIRQLDANDCLVFGRATYQGMAQYWPSPAALKDDPEVASRMNGAAKIVVSRTIESDDVQWANTRVVRDAHELAAVKQEKGKGILVLGSSVLTASLIDLALLDEVRVLVNPVLLGMGNAFASTLGRSYRLKLLGVRQFRNGNVLLSYAPAGRLTAEAASA